MSTAHFNSKANDNGTGTGVCNTIVSLVDVQFKGRKVTADKALVTCKRCLKMLETGSATTGILAAYQK